jgi:CRISPR/Cas system CSM-associated protein Csm2 small subunit
VRRWNEGPPGEALRLRGGAAEEPEAGAEALAQAEQVMELAKSRLERRGPKALAEQQRSQTDAHEQQRRALMADACARASQEAGGEEEEEEDMEEVMEALEELARLMAQFKELTKRQKERIERGNAILDDVMDQVTTNIPAAAHARKHVEAVAEYLRSTNRSHLRRQFLMAAACLTLIYLSLKL